MIKFQETEVLLKTSGHMDRLAKETIAIKLHAKNINREEGFGLSKAWNPGSGVGWTLSTHI
jgi:hypothetical protein